MSWPSPDARPARDPMLPARYRIAAKGQELADTWTLELEPAGDRSAVGEFEPGQFSMLYAFGAGEVPISVSRLRRDGALIHTVRAVGETTRAICAAEPGQELGVRGPFGSTWPLDEAAGGDVVVVTGGIGLAPLRPAIDHLVAHRDAYGAVSLLYGARSPDEVLYRRELDAWRDAGIDVRITVDTAPSGWRGRVGLVTELIPEVELRGENATAMVCGPEIMMRFAAAALEDRGVAPRRIQVSLERNMKCAIGHCGHCQLAHRFVCKDGPVFPFDLVAPLMGVREL